MKMLAIVNGYKGVGALKDQPLPLRAAHQLYMLRRELEPHVQFEIEQERELLKKLGALNEGGQVEITDPETMEQFQQGMNALLEQEVEIELPPAAVPLDAAEGARMTPEQMGWLDGLVSFE